MKTKLLNLLLLLGSMFGFSGHAAHESPERCDDSLFIAEMAYELLDLQTFFNCWEMAGRYRCQFSNTRYFEAWGLYRIDWDYNFERELRGLPPIEHSIPISEAVDPAARAFFATLATCNSVKFKIDAKSCLRETLGCQDLGAGSARIAFSTINKDLEKIRRLQRKLKIKASASLLTLAAMNALVEGLTKIDAKYLRKAIPEVTEYYLTKVGHILKSYSRVAEPILVADAVTGYNGMLQRIASPDFLATFAENNTFQQPFRRQELLQFFSEAICELILGYVNPLHEADFIDFLETKRLAALQAQNLAEPAARCHCAVQ